MSPAGKPNYKHLTAELFLATSGLMKELKPSKDFQDFVKGRKAQKMAEGINPDAVACAGRIIAKYREIGMVEFSDISGDLLEDRGADELRLFFPALKAAYGAIVAKSGDPELTTIGELEKMSIDTFTIGIAGSYSILRRVNAKHAALIISPAAIEPWHIPFPKQGFLKTG